MSGIQNEKKKRTKRECLMAEADRSHPNVGSEYHPPPYIVERVPVGTFPETKGIRFRPTFSTSDPADPALPPSTDAKGFCKKRDEKFAILVNINFIKNPIMM
ncbi:hypothetical protein PGTUg99_002400 [Puccinia graminis f. sp. tritici]|uniref:Uncharacterized protein n=1 Tax=Puccinia graminis f. sp. tritici TaxID=56615 RepID=A0A5B0QGS1_PUCGR|nr:hypothetical protein PGTUg99_000292 [Puccinia graminis f. sp. tritici]KAA1129806.1 hypothetical protein PGTUg99_002400 [Puccinia graminis f. sp. tritici]